MMLLLVIFVSNFHVLFSEPRSGPFKASYISVGECKHPALPIDKDPPSKFYAELYNTSTEINLMRGKTVIFREFRNLKTKSKKYVWEDDKWKFIFVYNMGCNRFFFPAIAAALGLKYDVSTCTFYQGEYAFSNYNIDKLVHIWMKRNEYGRYLWKVEQFSDAGTVSCYDYEVLIAPIRK